MKVPALIIRKIGQRTPFCAKPSPDTLPCVRTSVKQYARVDTRDTYMGNNGMGFPQRQLRFAEDLVKSLLLQERHEWLRVFIKGVYAIGYDEHEGLEIP